MQASRASPESHENAASARPHNDASARPGMHPCLRASARPRHARLPACSRGSLPALLPLSSPPLSPASSLRAHASRIRYICECGGDLKLVCKRTACGDAIVMDGTWLAARSLQNLVCGISAQPLESCAWHPVCCRARSFHPVSLHVIAGSASPGTLVRGMVSEFPTDLENHNFHPHPHYRAPCMK